jgi:hypothetical protein
MAARGARAAVGDAGRWGCYWRLGEVVAAFRKGLEETSRQNREGRFL